MTKIHDLTGALRAIPKKTYTIAAMAMAASFVMVIAEYAFALLLQVYICLLHFIPKDQIAVFLQPLVTHKAMLFTILFVSIVLQGICTFVQTYTNIAFAETFIFETRKQLLYNLFRPNSRWHYDLGTTSNIMAEIIPKGANFITSFTRFLVLLVQVIGLGILCLVSLPKEFIISILVFGALAPFVYFLNKNSRQYGSRILDRSQKLNEQLMKSVKNLIFVKILGMEQKERDTTVRLANDYYQNFIKTNWFYSLAHSVPNTFGIVTAILLFYFFNASGRSNASLLTMFYLLYRFIQALSSTVAITNGLSMFYPNFRSAMEIMKREQIEERGQKKDFIIGDTEKNRSFNLPKNINLDIKDLSFSYRVGQLDKKVFGGISFNLSYGQILVIKGHSGSGKSTLLMNLIGILSPTSGVIRWGDINLEDIGLNSFKRNIGYMGPEPYIISGTVYDNLYYGLHEKPTEEELITACKLAQAYDFIISSGSGFNTVLTERGEGLSMGQKQRLGLARALLRKPMILVLDEITANLDHDTETTVVDNIAKLKSKMVVLVATHSKAFDHVGDIFVNLGAIE